MRISFDIVLFISLFIAPWWVSLIIALGGVFFFNHFYEIIVAGIIMDIVYGSPEASFLDFPFISGVAALLFFVGGEYIKKRMIFY
ncbi:MAG: hypothetical protein HYT28_02285 [Parcubacteria group bacterium]|nr:hypothetical protein [Parcubacteria group bacterium]